MDEKRAEELFADEAFVKSLLALETPEEVQAAVKAKGVDLTLDEISAIKEVLAKFTSAELSDADLENVAGGNSGIPSLPGIMMQKTGDRRSFVKMISDFQKSIKDTVKSLEQKV